MQIQLIFFPYKPLEQTQNHRTCMAKFKIFTLFYCVRALIIHVEDTRQCLLRYPFTCHDTEIKSNDQRDETKTRRPLKTR